MTVHPLKAWRDAAGISQADLAARLEVDQASVARYEHGRRRPARRVMARIHEISGGAVGPADFYDLREAAQ